MPYDRMRSFNKHFLNKVLRYLAYAPRGPVAIIRHTGRRSGKEYETPIFVKPCGGSFRIALTYGSDVDWYRNVKAAGYATLLWHGREYTLDRPEPIDPEEGLQVFSSIQQVILRKRGTHDFVSMKAHRVAEVPAAARA